jgi:hypothetical protein
MRFFTSQLAHCIRRWNGAYGLILHRPRLASILDVPAYAQLASGLDIE